MAFSTSLLDDRVTNIVAEETILLTTGQNDMTANPATLHSITINNGSAAACYIFLYDARAAVTGQTPVLTFMVPTGQLRSYDFPDGIVFSTGICARATDNEAQNSAVSPGGGNVTVRLLAIRT
jgi:hypothetical protein